MRAYNSRKTCREHRNFFTKQHKLGFAITTIKNPQFYTANTIKILRRENIAIMLGRNSVYSIFKPIISKIMKKKEDNIL